MGYIIKINSESKQALAFLDYAKKLGFKVSKEKTALASPALNPQQEKFKKRMRRNLQQVELLKKGKLKTQPLDEFLNSL